ncbi:MAG: hypothetical protein RMH81_08970 [Thermomicrobium sp.]|nr:hypothetical protein [Thermomicrobium sp.]
MRESSELEQLRQQVWSTLDRTPERTLCHTVPVPRRVLALRAVAVLHRWLVVSRTPDRLGALAAACARLARVPAVLAHRIEGIDGQAVRIALLTAGLEQDAVRALVAWALKDMGRPAGFELLERGEAAQDDADLR